MASEAVHADVIVVGAGLSGLRAAVAVHEAGLSVVVLEADNRVGGKILSFPLSTGVVELGAAWINDSNQSEIYALAKKFGFELIEQRRQGISLTEDAKGQVKAAPYDDAPPKSELIDKFIADVALAHPTEPHLHPAAATLDATSFAAYAEAYGGAEAVEVADALATALFGVQAEEVSALFVVDYLQSGTGLVNMISDGPDGVQYLRNRQGNQMFATRLAELLPAGTVRLDSPVARISQLSEGDGDSDCRVETVGGQTLYAKRVIVSVPTTLYSEIAFSPPLPAAKAALGAQTALGYFSETIFVFAQPWWREAGLSGVVLADRGPIAFSRDTCVEADGQYSITCFHAGDRGRQWSWWSAAERRRQVTEHFDALLGVAARERGVEPLPPLRVVEKEWTKDAWAHGAPSSVMWTGTLTSDAGKAIRSSHGHVHFVGTETATVWKGYLEGAVRSGLRGAAEVVESLKT